MEYYFDSDDGVEGGGGGWRGGRVYITQGLAAAK